MGTHQLLIVILGIIMVGLAVFLAVGIGGSFTQDANADALVVDCMRIAAGSQQWYQKPRILGGGGNSYAELTLQRAGFNKTINENGSFSISNAGQGSAQIIATGKENVVVSVTVFPDSISSPMIVTN